MTDTVEVADPFPKGGGLYVHVPFCRRKCIYCDFFSAGERIADWHGYVKAISSELEYRKDELACPLLTVYIGGGTPSLMPAAEFMRLMDAIKPYASQVVEFTLEANPDDVCIEKLELWKRGGVNRLSIGIQSLDDTLLKAIGRRHDAATARRAYDMARNYFNNVSIDLMFGIPGQTVESWRRDLQEVIDMRPEHVSAYSLMYEEGTALTALRDSGSLAEADEELSEEMFEILIRTLGNAGYERYETSNFALPGFRSRHNSSYWLQKPYLGIGPSAHSYDGERTRKANRADLRGYLDYWSADRPYEGKAPFFETEHLSDEELLEEYVMTRMRLKEGIPIDDFRNRFGEGNLSRLMANSTPLMEAGLISKEGNSLRIKEASVMMSNSIILDLLK